MLRARVIPCLLLRGRGLVKTVRFRSARYLGDPINIVRIFNDKEVDELILLDIDATNHRRPPAFDLLREITSECFVPLCYGGGVRSLEDADRLFRVGIEKVAVNTAAEEDLAFVEAAANRFGSQSIVAAIDVKRSLLGRLQLRTHAGTRRAATDPVTHARRMEAAGAGELLLTSVDRDGTRKGYDLDLVTRVSAAVSMPVIACGGAGSTDDLRAALAAGASAVAAGSLFVFSGRRQAVLISYPGAGEVGGGLRS